MVNQRHEWGLLLYFLKSSAKNVGQSYTEFIYLSILKNYVESPVKSSHKQTCDKVMVNQTKVVAIPLTLHWVE